LKQNVSEQLEDINRLRFQSLGNFRNHSLKTVLFIKLMNSHANIVA